MIHMIYDLCAAAFAGDRIIAMDGNLATHVNWEGDCTPAEAATLTLLRNAVGDIRICYLRNGKAKVSVVHKKTPQSPLGLVIQSDAKWEHPAVREVDPMGPCFGELKNGDNIVSIEAVKISNSSAKLDTRHVIVEKHAKSVVETFLEKATGPIHVLLHRIENEEKRWDAQAMLRASSEARVELGEPSASNRSTILATTIAARFHKKIFRRTGSRKLGADL